MAYGTIGTGIQSPPATLESSLNAITQKYIVPRLGDAVMIPSPLFWALQRRGLASKGGGELVYPILGMEEMTGGAYYGDQLLNTTVVDSVTPANQVWRGYYQSLALPVFDIILNRGNTGVLDLVSLKFEIAASSLLQKLSRALWGTAPQDTSNDIDNLVEWVGSTNNTIAGISRAANSWFNPGPSVAGSGNTSPLTGAQAENAYQGVVYGYDEPDIFAQGPATYAGFKQQFLQNNRQFDSFQDDEAVQAGFRMHFVFDNAIVLQDRFVPANTTYVLNSKYLYPIFNEDDYFTVDPWVKPSNQRVVVSQIFMTWQLMCTSPRMNSIITNTQ